MIKAIAIDFGGVYYTWDANKFCSEIALCTGCAVSRAKPVLMKNLEKLVIGRISDTEYWELFSCKLRVKNNVKEYRKITERQYAPQADIVKLVKKLRKDFVIILLTNSSSVLDRLQAKYCFRKDFDIIIESHKIGMKKPNKNMYAYLLKKTNCLPHEIVLIDDSRKNIEGAVKAGIKGIIFKDINQVKYELKDMGINI